MTWTLPAARETLGYLVEQEGVAPLSFSDLHGDSSADVRNYRFMELPPGRRQEYDALVESTFTEAGIFRPSFLGDASGRRFCVEDISGRIVSVCSFRDASGNDVIIQHLSGHLSKAPELVWEVNNFAVSPDHRGGLLSAFLLFGCAVTAYRSGVDALAGVIRSSVIPALVHFGLVPTYHEPLHVLGKPEICDFICYYDTSEDQSIQYMWERAARFFYSEYTMDLISVRAKKAKTGDMGHRVLWLPLPERAMRWAGGLGAGPASTCRTENQVGAEPCGEYPLMRSGRY